MIYLDNAATTKPDRELLDVFTKIESEFFANPQSAHRAGLSAERYLVKARDMIADALHLDNHRVVFLSSATEANNLAIKGYALKHQNRGKHIIASNIEHPSVLEAFYQLRDHFGFEITILNVNRQGQIRLDDLRHALKATTILVSIMALNNEIGSLNPISEIAEIVHSASKAVLHVDTTQAIGKIVLPFGDIDLFVISGHKINGLKGSGALLVKKPIDLLPLLSGGNQEYGLRSSTVSVALAYTLALAVKKITKDLPAKVAHIAQLNSYLRSSLSLDEEVVINSPEKASPYIFNCSLKSKKASVVVEALSNEDIMISSSSACHAKAQKTSYVLKALGRDEALSANALRISFDNGSTIDEVATFLARLDEIIKRIRS